MLLPLLLLAVAGTRPTDAAAATPAADASSSSTLAPTSSSSPYATPPPAPVSFQSGDPCCQLGHDQLHQMPPLADPSAKDSVWVFGYGAVMHSTKLGNLNIRELRSLPAVLLGHRLAFNTCEKEDAAHAFSDLVVDGAHCVNGIARQLSKADWDSQKLQKTEPGYSLVTTQLRTAQGIIEGAMFFKAPSSCAELPPTARYGRLLYCGARDGGVCADYVERLRPLAGPSPDCSKASSDRKTR